MWREIAARPIDFRGWLVMGRPVPNVVPIAARDHDSRAAAQKSPEFLSDVRPVSDPYSVHAAFPDRWRLYLMETFGSDPERIAQQFGVTERAARKWLSGETGCKGGAVAIAMQLHPQTATRYLFAAE